MNSVVDKGNYLFVMITGTVNQQSLYDAQKSLMLHQEYPHKNSLWVFDETCECEFSNLGMFEMLCRIRMFFPIDGTKKKGALVGIAPLHHSFVKMFCDEAEHERLPFTVKPFRRIEDAESWLAEA